MGRICTHLGNKCHVKFCSKHNLRDVGIVGVMIIRGILKIFEEVNWV